MSRFPAWVPDAAVGEFSLIERRVCPELEREAQSREVCAILENLFSNEQMRQAWGRVSETAHRVYGERADGAIHLFVIELAKAAQGPVGTQNDTKGERTKRLNEINKAARKLASLVRATEFEGLLIEDFIQHEVSHDESSDYMPPLLSEALEKLAEDSPAIAYDSLLARPNDETANRAFFVRYLTEFTKRTFGTPLRSVVLAATEVAFDVDLDESQIIRYAP